MQYDIFSKGADIDENGKQRISGRVGSPMPSLGSELLVSQPESQEILKIYQRLFKLRKRDESELSKAISYGLKIRSGKGCVANVSAKTALRLFNSMTNDSLIGAVRT